MRSVGALAILTLCTGAPAAAARQEIDASRSTITVRVFKSGLFRAFADNHEIEAPIRNGYVEDGEPARVQIEVDAQRMLVLDPALSPHDRTQVQTRMLGPEVLDVNRFPSIRFESTSIDRVDATGWTVRGQLTLHGQSRPVTIKVVREAGHYRGSMSLRQTDFGITPITVAAGAVKVKDALTIDIDIVTHSTAGAYIQGKPSRSFEILCGTACAPSPAKFARTAFFSPGKPFAL
jgi:hypothetical protein